MEGVCYMNIFLGIFITNNRFYANNALAIVVNNSFFLVTIYNQGRIVGIVQFFLGKGQLRWE